MNNEQDEKAFPMRQLERTPQMASEMAGWLHTELKREIAKTDDDKKPPLAWLPPEGIRSVARVQAYGHRKYKDFNNYRKGMEVSRNCSCAMRHIVAFMDGETLDPESGENHLSHACCRLMFVLQNMKDGVAIDDRYVRKNKTT